MRIARVAAAALERLHAARGSSYGNNEVRRTNLSLVLHDHSRSADVTDAAYASARHENRATDQRTINLPLVGPSPIPQVDSWLTANVGVPRRLELVANAQPQPPNVIYIDNPEPRNATSRPFFRAAASLILPGAAACQVLVAAVTLRPGETSLEFIQRGPYRWPEDAEEIIEALERLIQVHVYQWFAPRELWEGPAERVLSNEIVQPSEAMRHQ